MTKTPDVLIVGAGPAGSALAYFLASRGLSVQLLDRAEFPREKTCGDGLSPRALKVLGTLGLSEAVLGCGFKVSRARVYAPNGKFISTPVPDYPGVPSFALVIRREVLDDLLLQHAVEAGADFRPKVRVTSLLWINGQAVGVLAESEGKTLELRARQVVLATGASISLLEQARLLPARPLFATAARAYYEGVEELGDCAEFHFDSIPLPGYGWVFPTSPTTANVGAGAFLRTGQHSSYTSPRQVFDDFVASSHMAAVLKNARRVTPVKGYPLRFHFAQTRLARPGLAILGEAAGLVDPFIGEGVDYALESAETAAGLIATALTDGTDARLAAQRYEQGLRKRFLSTYRATTLLRDFYLRDWVFNHFIAVAARDADFRTRLMNVSLGTMPPFEGLTPKVVLQVILG
jgi:menaquinone-9 beta-reductase